MLLTLQQCMYTVLYTETYLMTIIGMRLVLKTKVPNEGTANYKFINNYDHRNKFEMSGDTKTFYAPRK